MARVLIIEDDDAQRFVASFALKKAGHEVREAPDGPQGVAAAQAQRPDVIVCDVMMPGMTGYEVVTALRGDATLATVPVILLTAMSDRKHMRQGMTAGADDYLTKPYRPDELCEAVVAVLARRQAQQQAFMSSLSGVVDDALEQQKETLGREYENRLVREINARWVRAEAAGDIAYEQAFLLLADLLGPAPAQPAAAALADLVKQAHQSARDTLYLFGAKHVLPYGTQLLGVFAADDATLTTPPEARVLRAATALVKNAPRERPASVVLHRGPVLLVALDDGLHGDQGYSLAPGASLAALECLHAAAEAEGWRLAGSADMAKRLAPDHAALGRRVPCTDGEQAVELLAGKA